jgi:hypothetical protein
MDPGDTAPGRPFSSTAACAGKALACPDEWGPAVNGSRAKTVRRGWTVGSRGDQWPSAIFVLRTPETWTKTLALLGRRWSSPRGLLRPWGGDEGTRLDRTTLERGGSGGLASGMRICTPAMEELDWVLQRVIVLAFLGPNKGRVRFLWEVEAHACRGRGQRGS